MGIPAEQITQDDVIIRQQEIDRREAFPGNRPANFEEYLVSIGREIPAKRNTPGFTSLAELADKARRAPRVG
ncbi:MAG: hypothetical protein WAU86_15405 [Oricola sp.]